MAFEKGNTLGKGRPRGSPNKRSIEIQEIIELKLGKTLPEALLELLPDLSSKDKAMVMTDLLKYVYPARKAVEHSGPDGESIDVNLTTDSLKRIAKEVTDDK